MVPPPPTEKEISLIPTFDPKGKQTPLPVEKKLFSITFESASTKISLVADPKVAISIFVFGDFFISFDYRFRINRNRIYFATD